MDPHTAQSASESANWLWQLITVGGLLTSFVTSIWALVKSCRRQPPLPEELYKDFARKDDLEKLREGIKHDLAEGSKLFRENERTLGQLEGILKWCPLLCGQIKTKEKLT